MVLRGLESAEVSRQDLALDKIRYLTCLTNILPTGYHACVSVGVTTGSCVLVSGAGPAAPHSCTWRGGSGHHGLQQGAPRTCAFVHLRNN